MTVPKYWRKIPQYYYLMGTKCKNCGNLSFPPRKVCTKCNHSDYEDYKFKGNGEVVTFTIIRTPFVDPESEINEIPAYEPPYVLAVIQLEEGPRLTAQIDCDPEEITIGAKVISTFRKILENGTQGVIQYAYKFRLC